MRITRTQLRKIIRECAGSPAYTRQSDRQALYENAARRQRIRRALFEDDKQPTAGKDIKGGASADKAETLIKKIPGLENVLKGVDTKPEIAALIQALIDYIIDTGGVDQAEVLGGLQVAMGAAKKG